MTPNNEKILQQLPEPTLRRLPWYLAYVNLLAIKNVEYVSSTQISKSINVLAPIIAKDLSFLNIKGKTRLGYEVKPLIAELEQFLGFKSEHRAFICGVGSLGGALIQDSGLSQFGLNIVAAFDVKPELIGTIRCGVPIFDIKELAERKEQFNAQIGILAVPIEYAQQLTDQMVEANLKAIWNFTPFRILADESVVIQNTSIYAHLAVLYNRMNNNNTISE